MIPDMEPHDMVRLMLMAVASQQDGMFAERTHAAMHALTPETIEEIIAGFEKGEAPTMVTGRLVQACGRRTTDGAVPGVVRTNAEGKSEAMLFSRFREAWITTRDKVDATDLYLHSHGLVGKSDEWDYHFYGLTLPESLTLARMKDPSFKGCVLCGEPGCEVKHGPKVNGPYLGHSLKYIRKEIKNLRRTS